jgi:Tol biopolymer transport system component
MAPTWFDAQGNPAGVLGEIGDEYANPAISPDGTRVALAVGPATSRDIWILDVARGTRSRLTFDPASDDAPVWSPDGKNIAFSSNRSGSGELYVKSADGSGDERRLFKSDGAITPTSWSKDARFLLFTSVGAGGDADIWALPMHGTQKPVSVVQTKFFESSGVFSPDGQWVAYVSQESGLLATYVTSFVSEANARAPAKSRVSKGYGEHPRWRSDGKMLFYVTDNFQQLTAVDVDTSRGFQFETPRRVFAAPAQLSNAGWDLAPDGVRSLFIAARAGGSTIPFTVVLNWQASLLK